MSISVVVQFAALAVIAGIGVCVVYAIFEMREVYGAAIDDFKKLQPEITALLERVQSDGHALRKIALHIEVAVEGLRNHFEPQKSRPRKEVVIQDPEARFAALKDWLSANVPPYLEVEAEMVDGILMVGTREHSEKVSITRRDG